MPKCAVRAVANVVAVMPLMESLLEFEERANTTRTTPPAPNNEETQQTVEPPMSPDIPDLFEGASSTLAELLKLFDKLRRDGKTSPMLLHLRHEPLHIHKHLPSVESFHEAGSTTQTMRGVSSTELL